MTKIIEKNIAFMLEEVTVSPERSILYPNGELKITIFPNSRAFTPYGAFELAKKLILWASKADDSIAEIIKTNKW